MRVRVTAPPSLFVTVKPRRAGFPSLRSRTCTTTPLAANDLASAAARKSCRFNRRSIVAVGLNGPARLSGQPLAALRPAARNHPAAPLRRHAGTKAMAALADKLGGLKSALHNRSPSSAPFRRSIHGPGGRPGERPREQFHSLREWRGLYGEKANKVNF